jgi:hypothetical protein
MMEREQDKRHQMYDRHANKLKRRDYREQHLRSHKLDNIHYIHCSEIGYQIRRILFGFGVVGVMGVRGVHGEVGLILDGEGKGLELMKGEGRGKAI